MPDTRVPQTVAGLNDEQVVRLRCARIEDALVEVAVDRGYPAMIVDDVAAQGGLSRKTFYELYDDKAEAFFAAYDAMVHRIAARMRGTAALHRTPGDQIAAALAELLAIAEAEPTWARFCVIEAQTASALAGDHDRHLRPIVAEVERARAALGAAAPVPPAEQAAMVLGVLRVRLGADGHDLADLLPRFFELVSGEEWGDRPPLGEHRRQDGDAARAAAMEAALAAGDGSAVVELIVEAVVDHDPGTAAVGEAGLEEGSELAALLRAGTDGGALAVLRHLGLAAPAKSGMPRQARRVLEFILREPGVDGRAIRHSLSLSTESQVSRLLRDLREAGLIQDVSRQGPSRRWQITAAGRAALRKA